MMKITKKMIENWLGSDTDIPELLTEIANGEYKAKQFKEDIIDTYLSTQEEAVYTGDAPSTEASFYKKSEVEDLDNQSYSEGEEYDNE